MCPQITALSSSATVEFDSTQHLAALTLNGTSTATVLAQEEESTSLAIVTKALSIAGGAAPTAKLNLTNNNLIVDYTDDPAGSPYATMHAWVKAGANFNTETGEFQWDGNGIRSSSAGGLTMLAVVDNSGPAGGFGYTGSPTGPMEGIEVPLTAVVVKYTYAGDVYLDGWIDANDYNIIDGFFFEYWEGNENYMVAVLPGGPCYQMGDFNMDGVIDANDYNLIDAAYFGQENVMRVYTTRSYPILLPDHSLRKGPPF